MSRRHILAALFAVLIGSTLLAFAQEHANSTSAPGTNATAPAATHGSAAEPKSPDSVAEERAMRIEGEKRFRTNCGRCHMAPHKFPPRVMATAIRHMRVRATITEEDMRLILNYMTQ